jgi:hypothetical protein
MATIPPVPRFNTLLGDVKKWLVSFQWDNWFQGIANRLNSSAEQMGSANLSAQTSSVSATNLNSLTIPAGFYRVSYSQQVTRAASVSSSLTSSVAWTAGGVAQTSTNAAMTGNTTATHQEGMLPIQVDANTNVTYALTYASSGSPSMQYAFRATVEAL